MHFVYLLLWLPDEACLHSVRTRLCRRVGLTADDEDDCMIVEPKAGKTNGTVVTKSARAVSDANGKRKRTVDTSLGTDTDKKMRLSKPEDADVIMLD